MIYVIIAFGILVFIHEFGHFIVARLFKVKVEKFSIGFGPVIFSFTWKETKFQLGLIPLGGFCQFKDDNTINDLPLVLDKDKYDYLKSELDKVNKSSLLKMVYRIDLPDSLNRNDLEKIPESYEKSCLLNCYDDDLNLKKMILDKDRLIGIELLEEHGLYSRKYKLIYDESKVDLTDIDDKYLLYKEEFTKDVYKYVNMNKIRDKDTFYGIDPLKRLFIAFFGPFFNYIIAILFLTMVNSINIKEEFIPNKIVLVDDINTEIESSAKLAGLKTGDKIIKINNHIISNYQDIYEEMVLSSGKKSIIVTIERNGEIKDFIVHPKWNKDYLKPELGVYYYIDPVIGVEGKMEKILGLQKNDRIIEIVDSNIVDYNAISINDFLEKNLTFDKDWIFKVERNGEVINFIVNIKKIITDNFSTNNKKSKEESFYLNFALPMKDSKKNNIFESFYMGFYQSNKIVRLTYTGFISLIFRPKGNIQNVLGGPIKIGYLIAKVTSESVKRSILEGVRNFLLIMSNISLALAFFNLIPFPALDGSYILISFLESITKRSFRIRTIYLINMFGFIILLGLALIVGYFDIVSIIK